MENFDFSAPAEIYASKSRGGARGPMTYHRFATGAQAVAFAIEVLAPDLLGGAVLEVAEERYGAAQIRALYERADYPLERGGSRRSA